MGWLIFFKSLRSCLLSPPPPWVYKDAQSFSGVFFIIFGLYKWVGFHRRSNAPNMKFGKFWVYLGTFGWKSTQFALGWVGVFFAAKWAHLENLEDKAPSKLGVFCSNLVKWWVTKSYNSRYRDGQKLCSLLWASLYNLSDPLLVTLLAVVVTLLVVSLPLMQMILRWLCIATPPPAESVALWNPCKPLLKLYRNTETKVYYHFI